MSFNKKEVEELFRRLSDDLRKLGLEVNHHAEFISLLQETNTRKVVAVIYDDINLDWEVWTDER
jgi:hypothetical protein